LFSEQSFDVTLADDTANGQPFLEPLDLPTEIFVNQTLEFQLTGIDVEDDLVFFDTARVGGDIEATVTVDSGTGAVTITPSADAVGQLIIGTLVAPGRVSAIDDSIVPDGSGNFDRQDFVINVIPVPPFHQFENPPDVNGQDGVTALDALLIINALGVNGGEIDLVNGDLEGLNTEFNFNVNADNRISALDALIVINAIAGGLILTLEGDLVGLNTEFNVIADDRISSLDALIVINAIAAGGETEQAQSVTQESPTTPTEVFFANFAVMSPDASPWLDDDQEEMIYLRAQDEIGLQSFD